MNENDEYLEHFGILGMHWGVRRFQNEDGTLTPAGKKRYREAEKDAKEYARAKMFYGEGAGNRRKLIKASVTEKSKDPAYKEAFDYAMSKQNMDEHAKKAKSERHRKDAVKGTKRAINKTIAIGGAAVGTYITLHQLGLDKEIVAAGKKAVKYIKDEIQVQKWKRAI